MCLFLYTCLCAIHILLVIHLFLLLSLFSLRCSAVKCLSSSLLLSFSSLVFALPFTISRCFFCCYHMFLHTHSLPFYCISLLSYILLSIILCSCMSILSCSMLILCYIIVFFVSFSSHRLVFVLILLLIVALLPQAFLFSNFCIFYLFSLSSCRRRFSSFGWKKCFEPKWVSLLWKLCCFLFWNSRKRFLKCLLIRCDLGPNIFLVSENCVF